MSRRWTIGERGRCRCKPAPLGTEPAEVSSGGATPTLKRGDLEHTCPTAALVRRQLGRPSRGGGGAQLAVVCTPAQREHFSAAADAAGASSDSAWALAILLEAAPMPAADPPVSPEARATSARSPAPAPPGSTAAPRRRRR